MLADIVTQNGSTAQAFALVAVIVFIIAGVVAAMARSIETALICAGLAVLSIAFMFLA